MAKASKVQHLIVTTINEIGTLGNMTEALLAAGINIKHLCAYSEAGKAYFMILTGNNDKATTILKNMGYEVGVRNTLELEFENKAGSLAPLAKKLGENNVDIDYVFATSSGGAKVYAIMSTKDNDMALELINE